VTRLLGGGGTRAAVEAGVRLVSVSRPGYGGSTTSEAASLLAAGRDTAALAVHLGLGEYAVFGAPGAGRSRRHSGGRPCARAGVGLIGGVGHGASRRAIEGP